MVMAVDEEGVDDDGCRRRKKEEGSRWKGIYTWSQTLNQKPNAQVFKLCRENS
jgi:hypothetical protein